jgi:hypothetical protein
MIFWVVMLYISVEIHRGFGDTFCLLAQGRKVSKQGISNNMVATSDFRPRITGFLLGIDMFHRTIWRYTLTNHTIHNDRFDDFKSNNFIFCSIRTNKES